MNSKIFYWLPRVLAILAILFMMMFSLDIFEGNEHLAQQLLGLLIHNIPAFILFAVLIIAWKWEVIGGVIFILFSIAGSIFFNAFSGNPWSLIVMGPFLIIGILFIIHHVVFGKAKEQHITLGN
jgi:hypothetical protein